MLNAQEIIEQGNKPTSLPDTGGLKFFKVNEHDKEQKESIDYTLDNYAQCLKEERVCRKMNLSVASWKDELSLALVTSMKGSTVQKFGFQSKNGKFLYAEECLFLMEQGILELFVDEVTLSLQEAFYLLLPLQPSFEHYQIYTNLCRQGFLVNRYQPSLNEDDVSTVNEHNEFPDNEKPSADLNKINIDDTLKKGYMKDLWKGDFTPLMQPSESTSTAAVLSKLQTSKLIHLKKDSMEDKQTKDLPKFKIDFDVYTSKELRKQNKDTNASPQFRVTVCKYDQDPPTFKDLSRLTKEAAGVHLKIGVVNQGTVTFYGMFSTDLPTVISVP
ncbi:uncharacterized protein [Clytia hemisphaerica]|uniref:tRNA-splicing endonuclease subunit Sen54 N-terminal domain-containing protein n=1 Tax=Clytia hemisphaerica TaxID=252671 RepID=A0A7M5WWT6_9CNID